MDSTAIISNQLRAFRVLGMLPAKDSSYLYKLWGFMSSFIGGIGLVTCQALSILYVQSTNDLVKELLLFCTTSTVAVKIILFNLRRQHLLNVLDIMKTTDKQIENHEDINTMKNVYAYCRRIIIFYCCVYGGSIIALFFELIFLDRTERTWKSTVLVPNDFAQQPKIYYSVLAFQAVGNTFNCFMSWTLDTVSFLLISILSVKIEVLSLHLKKIGNSKQRRSASNRFQLLKHLDHYKLLADYATELNKQLSTIFFVQVSISAPIICTCAYQFSQAQNFTTTQLGFLVSYTFGMILQIFTPSYVGTNLVEKCDLLPVTAFSSEWYDLGQNEKKSLLIFITRLIRPFVIHAGNLFDLNTITFIKIVKSAYSLLAVLRSTQP